MNAITEMNIIIGIIILVIAWLIACDVHRNKLNTEEKELYKNLSNDDKTVLLLEKIKENQKKIQTNTDIIIVILLIPIIIGILIFAGKATIIIEILQLLSETFN